MPGTGADGEPSDQRQFSESLILAAISERSSARRRANRDRAPGGGDPNAGRSVHQKRRHPIRKEEQTSPTSRGRKAFLWSSSNEIETIELSSEAAVAINRLTGVRTESHEPPALPGTKRSRYAIDIGYGYEFRWLRSLLWRVNPEQRMEPLRNCGFRLGRRWPTGVLNGPDYGDGMPLFG